MGNKCKIKVIKSKENYESLWCLAAIIWRYNFSMKKLTKKIKDLIVGKKAAFCQILTARLIKQNTLSAI